MILCIGRFSDVPNIPEFPPTKGPEVFQGDVIHSKDYSAMDYAAAAEFVKGKKIAVVGFQKSALDIAMECSNVNGKNLSLLLVTKRKCYALLVHVVQSCDFFLMFTVNIN